MNIIILDFTMKSFSVYGRIFNRVIYTRVFDIDVIFPWEVDTNNKRLSLLTNSILWTSSVKFESNSLISLQNTVSESNQPPNFMHRWKKVIFVCWLNTAFCVEQPYQKPRWSSINIIRTLLRHMESIISMILCRIHLNWACVQYLL